MSGADRRYDLVLFGATGFTGRLVAEYLAGRAAGSGLRWALGGRNVKKLEQVRTGLAAIDPACADLPLIEADALDSPAMKRVPAETRVVCTTVGPYAQYGAPLVAACVKAGTHYCDLTGEVPFIRASIDMNHDDARASGARIVHCCGFDSVPSDLGTLFLQRELVERCGEPARSVTALFGETSGAFSGGTVASLLGIVDAAAHDRETRRLLGDPHGLDPAGGPRSVAKDARAPGWDKVLNRPTAPFIMAAINTRIVRRSHALLGYPWGEDFLYDERMSLPKSPFGIAAAVGITGALAGFVAATQIPALRRQLEKRLPKPGEGPDAEARARCHWKVRLHGEAAGTTLVATLSDQLDPGYGGTAKLLGEAALCLAEDDLSSPGGVLTPASAMGEPLTERLMAAGVQFDVAEA